MRDDRGGEAERVAKSAGLALALLVLASPPAFAQLTGQAQVQYQRVDQRVPLAGGGFTTRRASEFWLQNYELNHSLQLDRVTTLASQLRFSDLAYVGRSDASRTPYGTVRLTNPNFGLSTGYRPTTSTVTLQNESAPTQEVKSRMQETFFNGYVALPVGTRVNALWSRRHSDRDVTSFEKTSLNRSLRATQELGPLALRAGYGDVLNDPAGTRPRATQRNWDGGASLTLALTRLASVLADYGVARTQRLVAGTPFDRGITHTATVHGALRPSSRVDCSADYTYRALSTTTFRNTRDRTHDGAAQVVFRPGRLLQLMGAGGVRTAGNADRSGLLRFASASASLGGDLRRGWSGQATYSESFNWSGFSPFYAARSFATSTAWRMRRGLDLRGDFQVGTTGDTVARDSRSTLQGGVLVTMTPLRSFTLSYGGRVYQVGPGIAEANARARSQTINLRWTPLPVIELDVAHSETGSLPHNDPRLGTTTWILRLRPSATLQAWGSLTRSDQKTGGTGAAEAVSGHEVATARLVANLTPGVSAIAGMSVANRGRADEARQVDVAVTRRFGR
jgi:hypothetical protein